MKKMVLLTALAATLIAPAAMADWVFVDYEGKRVEVNFSKDVDDMNVCALKRVIAQKLGVAQNRFQLRPIRFFEYPNLTMKEAGIRNSVILEAASTSSDQC